MARFIARALRPRKVAIIHHDSYYLDRSDLQPSEREKVNYDHPDALETKLLVRHLQELKAGRAVEIPRYDFPSHTRRPRGKRVSSVEVVIVEGILIFTDEGLRRIMDVKMFLDAPADLRLVRRLRRDTSQRNRSLEQALKQYLDTVKPMHAAFVEPARQYADIIISTENSQTAVNVMVSTLQAKLQEHRCDGF